MVQFISSHAPITQQQSYTIQKVIPTIQQDDYIEHSYNSLDDSKCDIIHKLKQLPSIFTAMRYINEINRINGYKLVNDYDVKLIKDYFSDTYIEYAHNKNEEKRNEYNKQLQQGYMRLLTDQTN